MRPAAVAIAVWLLLAPSEAAAQDPPPKPRVVELKASDGTLLKATYFAAGKPAPGVILFHQAQRTRESWSDVAGPLAAAGINTLTVDSRGKGESGGTVNDWQKLWFQDLDSAFNFLVSQPDVDRKVIGMGGAGGLGVESAVETARRVSLTNHGFLLSPRASPSIADSAPAPQESPMESRRLLERRLPVKDLPMKPKSELLGQTVGHEIVGGDPPDRDRRRLVGASE